MAERNLGFEAVKPLSWRAPSNRFPGVPLLMQLSAARDAGRMPVSEAAAEGRGLNTQPCWMFPLPCSKGDRSLFAAPARDAVRDMLMLSFIP
jgi:hypothetical protein